MPRRLIAVGCSRRSGLSHLRRAICEALEQRRLLVSPAVEAAWFDFQAEASYTTRPHTLNFRFTQDVSASLDASDLCLEAVTGNEPDPIATASGEPNRNDDEPVTRKEFMRMTRRMWDEIHRLHEIIGDLRKRIEVLEDSIGPTTQPTTQPTE